MLDLDLAPEIAALRSTFRDIRAVVDVDALNADIERFSEEAGAPDLWDDTANAQKVTSALSHKHAELKRVSAIEQRIDDLEAPVELALEMDDGDSAVEARAELSSLQQAIGDLEVQTLLDGEWDDRGAVVTIRSGAGGDDATDSSPPGADPGWIRQSTRYAAMPRLPGVPYVDDRFHRGEDSDQAIVEGNAEPDMGFFPCAGIELRRGEGRGTATRSVPSRLTHGFCRVHHVSLDFTFRGIPRRMSLSEGL